jgi:uncharacterized protein
LPWARGHLQDAQSAWLVQRRAARRSALSDAALERLEALQKVYDAIDRPP